MSKNFRVIELSDRVVVGHESGDRFRVSGDVIAEYRRRGYTDVLVTWDGKRWVVRSDPKEPK